MDSVQDYVRQRAKQEGVDINTILAHHRSSKTQILQNTFQLWLHVKYVRYLQFTRPSWPTYTLTVEQEQLTLTEHPQFLVGFVLLDLSFYVYVLQIVVCPFILFLLAIVLPAFFNLRILITLILSEVTFQILNSSKDIPQ